MFALIALNSSCDDRNMESDGTASIAESETQQQASGSPEQPVKIAGQKPVTAMADPEEGVLHVVEEKGKVIVSGSIKGRYDKRDLFTQLKKGLPGVEIVDELEVGGNRLILGWEGRVGEGLLVPFLSVVDNAELHYEKGIIRLEGMVKEKKNITALQKAVPNVIYGPYCRDIENNLKVKEQE